MIEKIKLLVDFDPCEMTETDLEIIDTINSDIDNFIKANTIDEFCIDKPFAISSIQRLAKKLGFKTFSEMKQALISQYFQKLKASAFNNLIEQESDIKKIFNLNNPINYYLNFLGFSLSEIDWKLIKELENKIINAKTIFVFQYDPIFEFNSFDWYCSVKKIHLVRFYNIDRFNLWAKKYKFDKDCLFLITKFKFEDELENHVINTLSKNKIDTYLFTSYMVKEQENINQIIIGNFKRNENKDNSLLIFKIIHDQIINILLYSLFSKL